jgi:hypothetical protein
MMSSETDEFEAWEYLVTDGHVRAARLRWMQPWLVTIGSGFLVVGFFLAVGVSGPATTINSTNRLGSEVSDAQKPVVEAVNGLPPLKFAEGTTPQLVAAKEIGSALIPLVLGELNKHDRLPSDQVEISTATASGFWRKEWPHDKLIATGNDTVKLVGGVVNAGSEAYVVPRRWLGIFRKTSGKWQYATAEGSEMIAVENQPHVLPEAIPLTLSPTLPEER